MPWLLLLGSLVCADPNAAALDAEGRANRVLLAEDAVQAQRWGWGWGVALGAGAAGQLALAAWVHDEGFRIDRLVGATTSLVGVLSVIVTHPRARSAERELGACPTQQATDAALQRVAAEERFGRAWYQHVLGAAFNLGVGLYLGLAHDRWTSGALQFVTGTATSSLMILTRPRRVARLAVLPTAELASGARSYGLRLATQF